MSSIERKSPRRRLTHLISLPGSMAGCRSVYLLLAWPGEQCCVRVRDIESWRRSLVRGGPRIRGLAD
ncbi:uncharacterized protein SCHCODRAFT_02339744 [Schizophyllum commune H4-8]|uniref:uncharacterized protein n=1 Tax=Schizophyllum commune (strain H4-8 / FGSC 9210) TaxID=578458 RepID=UPI00215F1CEC|nr:uncharacterized protein SCHCODRAFT_02339744 [Schizophyllum commune H4-8]KAI5890242.1 hypothetical protein SCHCODRAFT_02339744 [Schizophyllum commune H4-8]